MAQGLQNGFVASIATAHPVRVSPNGSTDVLIERDERIAKNAGFPRSPGERKPRLRKVSRAHSMRDTEETQIMTNVKEVAFEADLLLLAAHQLLSPLAIIDSTAQRMINSAEAMTPEDVKDRAVRIRNATARLSSLAHGLMNRARIGGQQVLDRQEFDWDNLISRAIDHIRCGQPSRRITVEGADAPVRFQGDPLLLEQMLLIVLSNAAKYSPVESPIEIALQADAAHVGISIKDKGMGIPEGDLPRIFQPFFRSRNAICLAGTGLGLSLAERIARMHGGEIQVESQEGHGSTFTILLPHADSHA